MFKLIVIALLAGGIYYGYTKYMAPPSAAVVTYTQFANALAYGKYDDARRMATESAANTVEDKQQEMTSNIGLSGSVYGQSLPSVSSAAVINEVAGPIVKVTFKATNESASGDCTVIDGEQSVCREQPGCTGARCIHCAQSTHHAEVCGSSGGEWKVHAYRITETK